MFSSSYSPKSITSYNRNIEHLFYRYGISSNSENSLEEISIQNELNSDFILDLISCYNDYENIESIDFVCYRVPVLVDYLEKSHKYYINKRLPEIEQCLDKLTKQESNPLIFIVSKFFEEYKKERLGRYTKRIKINKLGPLIKNKDVIDFGCGHGQFLTSMLSFGANKCVGIDYGKRSIDYAKDVQKKLGISQSKLKFKVASVYKSGEKSDSYDFAIQNGVFHHLDDELKAYTEVRRVLKKDGYFWVYSVGKGGIKDITAFMCWKLLKDIDKSFVVRTINSLGVSSNKEYYLGDSLNALYNYRSKESLLSILKKTGFHNFKQLNGGYPTDFDEPFTEEKFFKLKYGSGDLRFLCQKK